MPPGDEYRIGGGKLKLKGSKVADGRIEKKKKKKTKEKKGSEEQDQDQSASGEREHGSEHTHKHEGEESGLVRREEEGERSDGQRERDSAGEEGTVGVGKTEAERKYEEQRKRRVCSFLSLLFLRDFARLGLFCFAGLDWIGLMGRTS